jgi:hypothetical protein
MTREANEQLLRTLNALRLNRRRLVGGMVVAAAAMPTAGLVAPQHT